MPQLITLICHGTFEAHRHPDPILIVPVIIGYMRQGNIDLFNLAGKFLRSKPIHLLRRAVRLTPLRLTVFREHSVTHGNELSKLVGRDRRQLVHGYVGQCVIDPSIFLISVWVYAAGHELLTFGQYLNGAVFSFNVKDRRPHLHRRLCAAEYK